ncbi:MAG: hypothetical protein EBR82_43335 [Caulobacteraceae bacterium]|nr:hypothetical protein [Caulobacteraceae bacterium]
MIFPMHVFKSPGEYIEHKNAKSWGLKSVYDEAELDQALANGWFLTKAEALNPHKIPADNAPPTRQELEEKANSLKIKFDGRTSDKRLLQMISEELGHGVD